MTKKEYEQLPHNYAHCIGTNCNRAADCMRHTAYKMLVDIPRETYTTVNQAVITDNQPCRLFDHDRREVYAWGISKIFDNVRTADFHSVKDKIISYFGSKYYHIKGQRCAITKAEQQDIRRIFTEMGYNGEEIEFDRYEEQYPQIMRIYGKH